MKNLLNETIEKIISSGHTLDDITFIGSYESGYSCTWDEFQNLADVEYDNVFGAPKVAGDLIILFKDKQYLYRRDYDGSEWWEYMKHFDIPTEKKSIKSLFSNYIGWETLEEIQKELL